jgi:RNA polymerase sigma factor (sigma-70 family)
MIVEQEDMILIQNILNGNLKAQEELYNKYKKLVKSFLKSKYSVYYDLDDDISEIMIKIFINLKSFDSTKSKFKSWVFSIAKNYMIDKWRNSSCTATLTTGNISFTSSIDANNITISNNENCNFTTNNLMFGTNYISCNMEFENNSSINYISSQISSQDFTLLDMKYVQGYDYCEIGKEFNVTSSTISNRVNYIKTKLKKNNPEIIYD